MSTDIWSFSSRFAFRACPSRRICYTLGAFANPGKTAFCLLQYSPRFAKTERRGSLKNIFVGNFSFNTSEDELRQLFEAYGQVERVSILTDRVSGRSRGFGFVEIANSEEGKERLAGLNGTRVGRRTSDVIEARP